MGDSTKDSVHGDSPEDHPRTEEQSYQTIYHVGLSLIPLKLPELAGYWLDELDRLGLSGSERDDLAVDDARHRFLDDPADRPPSEDVRTVRLDNGQVIRLRFDDVVRTRHGCKRIQVLANTRRTDRAIIAALTVLEGRAIGPSAMREIMDGFLRGEDLDLGFYRAFQFSRTWKWTHTLLKHHRPDFDDSDFSDENVELMHKTYEYIYEVLESVRRLMSFLEYGQLNRDTRPGVETAERDMYAATLRDVDGLTYREIAEDLDLPISDAARVKGDFSTVRQAVKRGRTIIETAFGQQGWQEMAEALRADAERWRSLSDEERRAEQESYILPAERGLMDMLHSTVEMYEDLL